MRFCSLYHAFFFFFGWWNYVIGFGRPSADSLFKRIMELTLCLWMEIKLVWMRDLGDGAGLWDSPSLSLSAIAFLNRVLTSCVRREGKMPPVHAVRTWSERPTPHFHIKDTCEGCCTVLTCKKKKERNTHTHSAISLFSLSFSIFSVLLFTVCLSSCPHLLVFSPIFDLCLSVSLPREQTLYSSVILTSCFCFGFGFSSFCLALPHLSLHPLTYCGAFLMKPLKTDCFHTGDRRHKQQQSPHCYSVTPGFWPLNPAQWSRTNAFESSDAPPLDPPHLPPPPKVLLLAPLYRRECFSTTGEDSSPAAHTLSYMKGFSMDSSCCSPQGRLTEQRHGESSEMHATEVYVKFKPRSEKFKPNMTPNMSQQMLNKENIHDTHCGTYES